MFDGPKPSDINNWVCVLERSTEYEVQQVKGYLANRNIPSNILSKRDSAFSLNVGETALVYLYVPKEYEQEARQALAELDEQDVEDMDDEQS